MSETHLLRRTLTLLASAALSGCGDIFGGDGPRPRLEIAVDGPATDEVQGLGAMVTAHLRDTARVAELRVYVDSGPGVAPLHDERAALNGESPFAATRPVVVAGPGEHRITVAITDAAGRIESASITRRFSVDDVRYAVTVLPDSGRGAGVSGVSSRGDVAGWIVGASGRRRPAVWRNGALQVVLDSDSVHTTAVHVNAAGDVLLQFHGATNPFDRTGTQVLRSDGARIWIRWPSTTSQPCCAVAEDLTDQRRALARSPLRSVFLDVAAGIVVDSARTELMSMNVLGMAAGHVFNDISGSTVLTTVGFEPPPRPPRPLPITCDPVGRYTHYLTVALDDAGNLLADFCANPVLAFRTGAVVPLFAKLGRATRARLSRQGGLVAALAHDGGDLYVWELALDRTRRVRVPGDAWRFSSLGDVNGSGVIAAEGVERTTGRSAALLLIPAP